MALDLDGLRSQLGLSADADEAAIQEALNTRLTAPPPVPDEAVVAASKQYRDELNKVSSELAKIKAERATEAKAAFFSQAVGEGRITPAERKTWEDRYDQAPDVIRDIVSAKAKGSAAPVTGPVGYVGGDDDATSDDAVYRRLFGDEKAGV